MRAARFHGKEDVRIEDVADPAPGPGQVLLRNAFAGICGSDLHMYFAPESFGIDFDHPHPLTGSMPPQIIGHEFSGTVEALGDGVEGVAVGDRVAVWPIYACGECAGCRRGKPNVCTRFAAHGVTSDGGGMAERTVIDAAKLHVLPEGVSLELGALVEPMAVAWHAVEQSGVEAGGSALIAGAGPIGIGTWFALRAHGVERVLVSEPSAERRSLIEALGASTVDPVGGDLAAAVAALTDGDGVDAAFDAAGAASAVLSALPQLTPGGRLVIAAMHERPVELSPVTLLMAETAIVGTLAYTHADFDGVIAAMADGVYDTTGWVETVGLDEVVASFTRLRNGSGAKVLVRSGG